MPAITEIRVPTSSKASATNISRISAVKVQLHIVRSMSGVALSIKVSRPFKLREECSPRKAYHGGHLSYIQLELPPFSPPDGRL